MAPEKGREVAMKWNFPLRRGSDAFIAALLAALIVTAAKDEAARTGIILSGLASVAIALGAALFATAVAWGMAKFHTGDERSETQP